MKLSTQIDLITCAIYRWVFLSQNQLKAEESYFQFCNEYRSSFWGKVARALNPLVVAFAKVKSGSKARAKGA